MSNCQAVVGVGDSTASCELAAPHPGTAHHAVVRHMYVDVSVDWVSDGEARAAQRKGSKAVARKADQPEDVTVSQQVGIDGGVALWER